MCDLYYKEINMTFRDSNYKTNCGAFFSIILVIVVVLTSLYDIHNIYKGKVESIMFLVEPYKDDQPQWTNKTFDIAVGLYKKDLDSVHLTAYFINEIGEKMEELIFDADCAVEHQIDKFGRYGEIDIEQDNITFFCLRLSKDDMIQIRNPIIELHGCSEKSKNCNLTGSKIQYILLQKNDVSNHRDTAFPVTVKEKYIVSKQVGTIGQPKRIQSYLIWRRVRESNGILIRTSTANDNLILDRMDISDILFNTDISLISQIQIKVNRYSRLYLEKEYSSIINSLAFLGGLFKGISMLFFVMVWPVREALFYKHLINNIFLVCDSADDLALAIHPVLYSKMTEPAGKDSHSELSHQSPLKRDKELIKLLIDNSKSNKKDLAMQGNGRQGRSSTSMVGLLESIGKERFNEDARNDLNFVDGEIVGREFKIGLQPITEKIESLIEDIGDSNKDRIRDVSKISLDADIEDSKVEKQKDISVLSLEEDGSKVQMPQTSITSNMRRGPKNSGNPPKKFRFLRDTPPESSNREDPSKPLASHPSPLPYPSLDLQYPEAALDLPSYPKLHSQTSFSKEVPSYSTHSQQSLSLSLSFVDYLQIYLPVPLCGESLQAVLFKKGISLITSLLDIRTLLSTYLEFKKLKMLLFDDDQLELFNCIPRPLLGALDTVRHIEQREGEGEEQWWKEVAEFVARNEEVWERSKLLENHAHEERTEAGKTLRLAIERVTAKGDKMNVIDKRLLEVVSKFRR